MNIIEAIKTRRSVRTFNGRGLTGAEIDMMSQAIADSYTLFGGSVTIRLKKFDLKNGYKPSTYGVIKGAEDFFLIGMADDEASSLTAGFQFEQIVLRATEMGLGTCWIAATYKGSAFEVDQKWPEGERLRIISPVGEPAAQSVIEKISRAAIGSNKRKPFDQLFFQTDFETTLGEDSPFGEALEMLRLAPSSTNSQPWRAVVCGDVVHFYYQPKSKVSVLDCGIGLCHFYETEKFRGHDGSFEKTEEHPAPPKNLIYLISYRRK